MNNDFIIKLKETFQDAQNIKPEQMQSLMKDALAIFQELRERMKSGDPKAQQEAALYALELKAALEEASTKITKTSGLQLPELVSLLDKQPPQTESGKALRADFDKFKKEINDLKKPKARSHKRSWLAS